MAYQSMGMMQQQRQVQTMAPQMRHSLEMLQMPIMELRAAIQKEMEVNPVIEDVVSTQELVADTTSDSPDDIVSMSEASLTAAQREDGGEAPGGEGSAEQRKATDDKGGEDKELDFAQDTIRDLPDGESEYFFDDDSPTQPYTPEAERRRQHMFDSLAQPVSLQMRLIDQLLASGLSKDDMEVGEAIIGALDDGGLLPISLDDIAFQTGARIEDVERVLHVVQSFDPPGIAARDAGECLLLQLDALDDQDGVALAKAIVSGHLKAFSRRDYAAIAASMRCDVKDVERAAKVILRLNPSPASAVDGRSADYVTPEVFVERDGHGGWTVRLDDDQLPRIRISKGYRRMLADEDVDSEAKSYIRERMRAGSFLMRCIEQRQQTILRISTVIVDAQREFLERGVAYLKPMTMSAVADEVGMHETTVSRAVSNKYMKTPRGVFELRYFFSTALKTSSGESVSNKTVQDRIAAMIKAEDPAAPLSDQAIADKLSKNGVTIARRTVVKYRDKMRIPPSHLRRRA